MTESSNRHRRALPEPCEPSFSGNNELNLEIGEDFSERGWAAWFGEVQEALETMHWHGQPIVACHVDLSACRWADPLPLLSLALCLANFEANGKNVRITLPAVCEKNASYSKNNPTPDCLKRTRLLKFLAREGFLELLSRRNPFSYPNKPSANAEPLRRVTLGASPLTEDDLYRLKEAWAPLAFEESTCLPARLLAFSGLSKQVESTIFEDIDRWVERALDAQISPVVADKVPAWAQVGIKYRLQILLREALHNIAEHAYKETGLAALYVRYREGGLGQAPSAWTALEEHVRREEDNQQMALLAAYPRYHGFARTRAGFFEVFILDAGRGFVERITEDDNMKHLLDSPNPFHHAMHAVFKDGYSSKQERATEHGGLHLLQQLLEPAKDYLRGRDLDTWWGRELPLPLTQSDSTPQGPFSLSCEAVRNGKPPIRGLAWTARLSWLDPTDRIESSIRGTWRGMSDRAHRTPLLEVLRDSAGDISDLRDLPVQDWRLSGDIWSNVHEFRNAPAPNLMVLPAADWMKNSIQDRLAEVLKSGSLEEGGILWVGEIASVEALTYLAAIRRAKRLFNGLARRPKTIVLITRDLRACILELSRRGLYEERAELADTFVRNNPDQDSQFSWRLLDYYKRLRLHDGRRLWQAVGVADPSSATSAPPTSGYPFRSGTVASTPYLEEWVDWHGQRCLDGYLDFPGTLTHPVCREIYGLSLQRLMALFPDRECRFTPLDTLVESLIVRFRAQQRPRAGGRAKPRDETAIDVHVGSVQVSGLTEKLNRGTDENPITFHFLRHPSGNAGGFYLLPWLAPIRNAPPEDCTKTGDRPLGFYERVGRTPAIARDGWKAYRMPRFDAEENPIYEDSPRDSYRTWQDASRSPMKIGHWSYGGHHDLLTINLLLAFDTELDQISLEVGGALGRFVYANLFRVLDIRPEHLCEVGRSLYGAIQKDEFRNLLPLRIGHNKGLLIFPSHPVTDHVVDRLLAWIADRTKLADVLSRCLPILPLRRHRGGSGLQLSGLTLERLKSFVASDPGEQAPTPPVVFFDDAMVSGRTFLELKSLLHDLGLHDIYSIVMLDRQRLPSAHHVNRIDPRGDGVRDACYWRLDAPALGGHGHCPLCRGLGRVRDQASRLTSLEHRTRVQSWQRLWSERNPATEWGDGGLRPIPIDLKKSARKFGIVPDEVDPRRYRQAGGEKHQIQLTNSAGLVAWVTELYSVTSRDDLPLGLIQKEELPPEVRIQLLSSQLLLFFGEYDDDLAQDLGYQLVVALSQALDHDRNTAFAGLTLMACGNRFLTDVMQRLVQKVENEGKDRFKISNRIRRSNLDFQVLLELCALLGIDTGPLIPPHYSASVETAAQGESEDTPNRKDLYRRLYREVRAGQSDSHSASLSRFVNLPPSPALDASGINDIYYQRAKESATNLRDLVAKLDSAWLRNDDANQNPIKDEFKARSAEIAELSEEFHEAITQVEHQIANEPHSSIDLRNCQSLAETLLNRGTAIFHGVFARIGIGNMRQGDACALLPELERAIGFAQTQSKTVACVQPDRRANMKGFQNLGKVNLQEAYVVWDSDILTALDEILSNVKHTYRGPAPCPKDWDDQSGRTAHLWIFFQVEPQHLALVLRHRSKRGHKEVARKMKGKNCTAAFASLDGGIAFDTVDGFLQTTIRIPYAHTMGSDFAGDPV